jgi:hypothetical protein
MMDECDWIEEMSFCHCSYLTEDGKCKLSDPIYRDTLKDEDIICPGDEGEW